MDPEIVAGDAAAVELARLKNMGATPVIFGQTTNIPAVYVRPGSWPADVSIEGLPSVVGFTGSGRTVHPQKLRAQSQSGSTWNLPPFTWSQQAGGIISQILSQRPTPIRDRLALLGR